MKVLLGMGIGAVVVIWIYRNFKKEVDVVVEKVKVEVPKIVEVATDSWRN